jgi:hypothetical protein
MTADEVLEEHCEAVENTHSRTDPMPADSGED